MLYIVLCQHLLLFPLCYTANNSPVGPNKSEILRLYCTLSARIEPNSNKKMLQNKSLQVTRTLWRIFTVVPAWYGHQSVNLRIETVFYIWFISFCIKMLSDDVWSIALRLNLISLFLFWRIMLSKDSAKFSWWINHVKNNVMNLCICIIIEQKPQWYKIKYQRTAHYLHNSWFVLKKIFMPIMIKSSLLESLL